MHLLTDLRRKRLKRRPFPTDWLADLERSVPLYQRLNETDRSELQGHIQVFLAEKNFEGLGGFVMTNEARVIIAAQASILLLHRDPDYYPRLSSIIVYPGEFLAPFQEVDEFGVVSMGLDCRSGEACQEGALVLSWEDVEGRGVEVHAGYNVVLHEFAHLIDADNGITSGAPSLLRNSRLSWTPTFEREYLRLQRDAVHRRTSVLDPYGAESPAEFFAVATECFFERPRLLKETHRGLYGELERFYRQDPASW